MPISSGRRDKYLTVLNPDGRPVPDGDGGFSQQYKEVTKLYGSITPATARSLERFRADTVIATASSIIVIPFLAGVTTDTRLTHRDRTFEVRGFADPDERGIELILACEELAQATEPIEDAS